MGTSERLQGVRNERKAFVKKSPFISANGICCTYCLLFIY